MKPAPPVINTRSPVRLKAVISIDASISNAAVSAQGLYQPSHIPSEDIGTSPIGERPGLGAVLNPSDDIARLLCLMWIRPDHFEHGLWRNISDRDHLGSDAHLQGLLLVSRFRLLAVRVLFAVIFRPNRAIGLVRLGSDYGGWWIPSTGLGPESICYCVGVGEDATFDLALVETFGCQVISLDPTPRAVNYMKKLDLPEKLNFLAIGVADSDRDARFYEPRDSSHASFSMTNLQRTEKYIVATVKTPRSLMNQLGHTTIDLIKLDIEGAEYEVIDSLHREEIYPRVLCVELDQPHAIFDTWRTIRRLNQVGYETVSLEGLNITLARKHDQAC